MFFIRLLLANPWKTIRGSPCSFKRKGEFISLSSLVWGKSQLFVRARAYVHGVDDVEIEHDLSVRQIKKRSGVLDRNRTHDLSKTGRALFPLGYCFLQEFRHSSVDRAPVRGGQARHRCFLWVFFVSRSCLVDYFTFHFSSPRNSPS